MNEYELQVWIVLSFAKIKKGAKRIYLDYGIFKYGTETTDYFLNHPGYSYFSHIYRFYDDAGPLYKSLIVEMSMTARMAPASPLPMATKKALASLA
jgi:hypothetical protein